MRGAAHEVSPAACEAHRRTAPHKQKGRGQQAESGSSPAADVQNMGKSRHSAGSRTNAFQLNVSANRPSKAFVQAFPNITYPELEQYCLILASGNGIKHQQH